LFQNKAEMNSRIRIAALLGLVGVVLGALGSHALKARLAPEALESFEVGVHYQMLHALLLLAIEGLPVLSDRYKRIIARLVLSGVLTFSGSIYLLSTRDVSGLDLSFLGPVTPVGGLLLIAAWGVLIRATLTYSPR
jgi:uncharacterized membrane protein YgdD (TMEM256/DUF423 family)